MFVTEDLLSLKQSKESGGLLHQLVHKSTHDHSHSANCHNNNNKNNNNNNFTILILLIIIIECLVLHGLDKNASNEARHVETVSVLDQSKTG